MHPRSLMNICWMSSWMNAWFWWLAPVYTLILIPVLNLDFVISEFGIQLLSWDTTINHTIAGTIFGSWLKKTEKKVWNNQEELNIAWVLDLEELLLTLLGWAWCGDRGSEKTLFFRYELFMDDIMSHLRFASKWLVEKEEMLGVQMK